MVTEEQKKEVVRNIIAKANEFNKAIADGREINIHGRYGFSSTDGIYVYVNEISEITPIILDEQDLS